ncbi:hypothetical protein EB796_013813 [Bugula neritina]|uniref:Uncharacterized protein n=1 Tax=Bugula neritina TaxID=10212 RepID=A0A7J7JNH3_BUGNE|nr:hypothetical protein EB796_013813 [Bugula neritina]
MRLESLQKLLICLSPHGYLVSAILVTLLLRLQDLANLGIDPHLIVLDGHFQFPLYREYFMTTGIVQSNSSD